MRPKLTKESAAAMGNLSRKKPNDCDTFERTVGLKVSTLSQQIEQGNARILELEKELSETGEIVARSVGEYKGWCDSLASYYKSQVQQADGGPGIPITAPGGAMLEAQATKLAALEAITVEPQPEAEPQPDPTPTGAPQDEATAADPGGPAIPETDATAPDTDGHS